MQVSYGVATNGKGEVLRLTYVKGLLSDPHRKFLVLPETDPLTTKEQKTLGKDEFLNGTYRGRGIRLVRTTQFPEVLKYLNGKASVVLLNAEGARHLLQTLGFDGCEIRSTGLKRPADALLPPAPAARSKHRVVAPPPIPSAATLGAAITVAEPLEEVRGACKLSLRSDYV